MATADADVGHDDAPIAVETKLTDAGTWARSLNVTVPVEAVNKEFDVAIGELAGALHLRGFRPGHVPRAVVEKRFGDDIRKQVTASLLRRALHSAILKEKLDIVGEPVVDAEKLLAQRAQPFSFSVDVEVKPAFELSSYKGLIVEQEEVEVLPEEMDEAVNNLRERFAAPADAAPDHPMGERDMAEGALRFIVDGKEVHKEDGRLLLMDGHVMGAYAHLDAKFIEGAKVGEKRTIEETLGDSFPVEAHRGKKATIESEVAKIRVHALPPVDDALAQRLGLKTLEELKEKVRASLLEKLGEEIRRKTQYELLDRAVATSPFELPKRLQATMSNRSAESTLSYLARLGLDPKALGAGIEQFTADARERAIIEIRRFFVLDAICAKEGIAVTEEDIDEEIVRRARSQSMRASELYDKMVEDGSLPRLEADLKIRKALEFLVEQADVRIVPRKPRPKTHDHDHGAAAPAEAAEHGHEHGAGEGHEQGHEHADAQGAAETAIEQAAAAPQAGAPAPEHEHGADGGHEHGQ
ncbi:MAG: trigger factor [Planctomycetota bacterium]|nr:trigger factor [Planctomycetota bacterium]